MNNRRNILSIILDVILACVAMVVLPDPVAIQFGIDGNVNTMPKILAIGIAFAITLIGSILSFKQSPDSKSKIPLIIEFVGLFCFLLLIVFNG